MPIARLFRPLCALILLPFVTLQVAGQGRGNATPRDPMQEGLPLKPTRTANWTTKVGHWMSVDVSPDGQTLVFDLLGDLYTMPSSGGQLQGFGDHWELWSIAMGGMSNHEALRIATSMGATAIGLGKDIGTIESGKLADLVVLDRNPLDNIRNTAAIRYVMKNGRLYNGNSLDEIYPRVRKAGPFYRNDEEGVDNKNYNNDSTSTKGRPVNRGSR